ncbi:MAG: peptide chain release factor N(5)-glutamine methyltransferase [Patescibacteria group bacterium]
MDNQKEREHLIRDKYDGDSAADLSKDLARLENGEPLAYVIGWIPFLGLRIDLNSKPLIPRPETEAWTEDLHVRLKEKFGDAPFTFLDLCAGSGAIGLSVLASFPAARVRFSELVPEHARLIRKNIEENDLDASRATVHTGDLFAPFPEDQTFDVIATNPPYVPEERALDASVTGFEPAVALYAGSDGLDLVRRIAAEAADRLEPEGELWMECDIENIEEAKELLLSSGAKEAMIRNDLYGRPRVCVGYYP